LWKMFLEEHEDYKVCVCAIDLYMCVERRGMG
jgi:hypothetical protein